MVLKLNGKPLELSPLSPTAQRILDFLKRAPADEVFYSEQVAEKLDIRRDYLKESGLGAKVIFHEFTIMFRNKRIWGNPKAIAELKKQVAG